MRILLVSVYFHSSFGWSIERALLRAGHEVQVFDYRENAFQHIPGLRDHYTANIMPRRLLAAAGRFKPELVILAKAELVPAEIVKTIRHELRCRLINWFPDGRLFAYYRVIEQLPHLDFLFSKSELDLRRLKLLGLNNGHFLLHCADRELHTQLETAQSALEPYACQVAVVGSYYPYRDHILAQLLDFNIRIWGSGWRQSRAAKKQGAVVGREARSFEQAMVFRGASVSINPHHYDDVGNLNQRVFDICGSGGCQLTDGPRDIEKVFCVPEEVAVFVSIQELREKIDHLLRSPQEAREMGARARKKTAASHTYDHRVAEVMDLLAV